MNSTVLCGSRHGSTRRVAEAIAAVLRRQGVGGPTEGHAVTPAVAECLDRLASAGLHGVPAAAFDTRLRCRDGSPARRLRTSR